MPNSNKSSILDFISKANQRPDEPLKRGGECPAIEAGIKPGVPKLVEDGRGFCCPFLDGTEDNFFRDYSITIPDGFPGIVVDTREKDGTAWEFEHVFESTGALKTGDYSVLGFEDVVTVERKAWSDLIGCMTSSRDRFERELVRMSGMTRAWVLVEADSIVSLGEPPKRSKIGTSSIVNTIASWEAVYGVSFKVIPRAYAPLLCTSLLVLWWKHHEDILWSMHNDFWRTELGHQCKEMIKNKGDREILDRLMAGI